MIVLDGEKTDCDGPNSTDKSSTLRAGLSSFWRVTSCHFPALAIWHWRYGTRSIFMDRSAARSRSELVAGPAIWSYRVWRLSLSSAVILCQQRVAHQPRASAKRWIAT